MSEMDDSRLCQIKALEDEISRLRAEKELAERVAYFAGWFAAQVDPAEDDWTVDDCFSRWKQQKETGV